MVPTTVSRALARGMFFLTVITLIVGLALLPTRTTYSADPYAVVRVFVNPSSGADEFGTSVAWVDSKALIGAPGYDPGGLPAMGAAYVYSDLLITSTAPLLLTQSNPITEAERFGSSVAALGSQALIGAPGVMSGTIRAGGAFAFDATTGQQVLTMTNPSPDPDPFVQERFGAAVAEVNGQVVVGAPGVKVVFNSVGEAYRMDGSSGIHSGTWSNPGPVGFESFGEAVAGYGAFPLIGSPREFTGGFNTDYGMVYKFDPITSTVVLTFTNPTPVALDEFGASIAVFGNQVLIGAPGDDSAGASDAGAAYLFDGDTGELLYTFSLTRTTQSPASTDHFGAAVSLNGEHILIGAPDRDVTGAANTGAAYLFDAVTFSFIQVLSNPSPEVDDGFGTSVAVNTDLFLVGAPKVGADVGEAYLFSFAPPTPTPAAELYLPVLRRAIPPTP